MPTDAYSLASALLGALVLAGSFGCSDDDDGSSAGPGGGATTPTELAPDELAPGIEVVVLALQGASGPAGAFLPGDRPALRFRLEKEDGSSWQLSEMVSGEAMVSGPTKNYQRLLPASDDVRELAAAHADGSYTYRFAPLPATYAPPYNDSPAFGAAAGELLGEPVDSGTYTLGLSFAWAYEVSGASYLDVGEVALDVLFGPGAGELAPRRVTQVENCNRCHGTLTAHGGRRRNLTHCLMCHTAGAEDANLPEVEGGTPGVTIDSRVLFHKIHNGAHLPSVIGIAVGAGGVLDYAAAPKPYRLVDGAGNVHDYSEVGFPAWPNRTEPMPEAPLYAGLSDEAKAKEDRVRTGVTSCYLCHDDPDGAGPIEAPADGELIHAMLTYKACGACHDDIEWDKDYIGDLGLMPPASEAECQSCHPKDSFNPFSPLVGHRHPLRDPAFNPGLVVELLGVAEAGAADQDGTLDAGEKIALELAFHDDTGDPVPPALLDALTLTLSGPTANANLVNTVDVPPELLAGLGTLALNVPVTRRLELLGASSGALGDVFATALAPHLDLASAPTVIGVRTGFGAGIGLLSEPAAAGANFLDLTSVAGFQRGDYLVVEDGTPRAEYLQVQFVEGARLWFSSPSTPTFKAGLAFSHAGASPVLEVLLAARTAGVDYALDAAAGTLVELVEFGAGNAVLANYTSDFTLPAVYPNALNGSPDLGADLGEWSAAALLDGTYTLAAFASYAKDYDHFGTPSTYRIASEAASAELLVGGALVPEPYALIDDPAACNACHQDLSFHGRSARGFSACRACHGTAGAEDLPRYVAANAPPTPGARVDLRSLLHKIHHARELDDPAAFELVGAGSAPYPDNFELSSYASILFPAQPGASQNCATCHGAANTSWRDPADAAHPDLNAPVLAWKRACGACHDAPAALAHMDVGTSAAGVESCAVCHGAGEELSVENAHRPR
jgi:hypothetical protein